MADAVSTERTAAAGFLKSQIQLKTVTCIIKVLP